MMSAPTNNAVNDPNDSVLKKFTGLCKYKRFSVTQIEAKELRPEAGKKKDRLHIVITPEMTYGFASNGVPPH